MVRGEEGRRVDVRPEQTDRDELRVGRVTAEDLHGVVGLSCDSSLITGTMLPEHAHRPRGPDKIQLSTACAFEHISSVYASRRD